MLIADSRSYWRSTEDFDLNAAVIDPSDNTVKRFHIGDGITKIALDALDRIWVSYFDEGVFGNCGWSYPGPTGIGSGGLNCFECNGKLLWQHNSENNEGHMENHIDDCYAMNSINDTTWFYFYSAFRLGCVTKDHKVRYCDTEISGSGDFISDGQRFIFSPQYNEPRTKFHLAQIHWGKRSARLDVQEQISLCLPKEINESERWTVVSQADQLHVLGSGFWATYQLQDIAAQST